MNEEQLQNQPMEQAKQPLALIVVLSVLIGLIVGAAITYLWTKSAKQAVPPTQIEQTTQPAQQATLSETKGTNLILSQKLTTKQGLNLSIPEAWEVLSNKENEIKIRTATQPYEIIETINILPLDTLGEDLLLYQNNKLYLYLVACAPAISCINVDINGTFYSFHWNVPESNEPAPDNLDGPWFPSANFDSDDVLEIMKTIDAKADEDVKEDERTFEDAILNLSFQYPEKWGGISIKDAEDASIGGQKVLTGRVLSVTDIVFLHGNNPNTEPTLGRGAYWGDDGMNITSKDSIEKWCDDKVNCSLMTNSTGVLIAKVERDLTMPYTGEPGQISNHYYLYNPNSDFIGVVLSDNKWKDGANYLEIEKQFEDLVDSIRLLTK